MYLYISTTFCKNIIYHKQIARQHECQKKFSPGQGHA